MKLPLLSFIISIALLATISHSYPLSTSSRWIIDADTGRRVKLTCAIWAGHLETMVPEGLNRQPLKKTAATVASLGFNCVRLTWATYMFTRGNYVNLTVAQSLDRLDLTEAKEGIAKNNPQVLNLTLFEAQKAVVDELGANNLMVILDNHVSLPKWCCGNDDGNGFFEDQYFDPQEWMDGLREVASHYQFSTTVVGMSMRNELRGPHQNHDDWYKYMQQGAIAIHERNPNILVIVSGFNYDTDLGFLRAKPFKLNFTNSKLVFEVHWYPFGNPSDGWLLHTNGFCANETQRVMDHAGFLMGGPSPTPLILSEFGMDQKNENEVMRRYFSCVLSVLADTDMEWFIWTLQGSYMIREGTLNLEETFGVLDANWDKVKNPKILQQLQFVQKMIQDPNSNKATNYIIFHPLSGRCLDVRADQAVELTDCMNSTKWSRGSDGATIQLAGSSQCLNVAGYRLPPVLSDRCTSTWGKASLSTNQLAAKDKVGNYLCLSWNPKTDNVTTNQCLCMNDDLVDVATCSDNPQEQWFKLVPTNIN